MLFHLNQSLRCIAAAFGAAAFALIGHSPAVAQTLPIAGNAAQAAVQDQADRRAIDRADNDAVRGVREQDQAALRTANRLNRDLRQEARQELNQATRQELNQAIGQNAVVNRESNIRAGIDGTFHDMNVVNSG